MIQAEVRKQNFSDMKEGLLEIALRYVANTKEANDLVSELLLFIRCYKSVCPNPDCKSKNITHEETYDYCEDCRRMFNGHNK